MLCAILWNFCVRFWNYVPLKVAPPNIFEAQYSVLSKINICVMRTYTGYDQVGHTSQNKIYIAISTWYNN